MAVLLILLSPVSLDSRRERFCPQAIASKPWIAKIDWLHWQQRQQLPDKLDEAWDQQRVKTQALLSLVLSFLFFQYCLQ